MYVELQAAPWIWRVAAADQVSSHTGIATTVTATYLDETGRLYLETGLDFGLVHTQDIVQASEVVEAGRWVPQEVRASDLPARFGYVTSPARQQAPASA